jgi:hypothetical protein
MVAWSLVLFALVTQMIAQGSPDATGRPPIAIDKKAKEKAAAETASAVRKMQRRSVPAGVETTMTVIPLKGIKAKDAAKILKKLYRKRPGFVVAAIPELGCVIIRADAKTKKEAIGLLMDLTPLHSSGSGQGR